MIGSDIRSESSDIRLESSEISLNGSQLCYFSTQLADSFDESLAVCDGGYVWEMGDGKILQQLR